MYLRTSSHSIRTNKKTSELYILETKTPVACVAIAVDEDSQQIFYSVAICNPKDVFDKNLAKDIAIGRMRKDPLFIPLNGVERRYTISGMVVRDILDIIEEENRTDRRDHHGVTVPPTFSRAVEKAAKTWLKNNPDYAAQDPALIMEEGTTPPIDTSAKAELIYNVVG